MGLFLFFSLFFPRASLLMAWICNGVPINNVPLFFDGIGAVFFPRLLILYYIWYAELGLFWFIAHILALVIRLSINSDSES